MIPSAPGKRTPDDTKVTDLLYSCYGQAILEEDECEENFESLLAAIKKRYEEIISGLGLTLSLDDEFRTIRENFSKKIGRDYAASRGEYLNGIIMAAYLGYELSMPQKSSCLTPPAILTRRRQTSYCPKGWRRRSGPLYQDSTVPCQEERSRHFPEGVPTLRGSIVSKAVHADLYENWTDVSGFLIADPRIVRKPKSIDVITYRELRELSYMGATVLHEDAIFPVRKEGIPINIRNTNSPEDKGTLIVEGTCRKPRFVITGIAGKKDFASITVEKAMMNSEVGFCKRCWKSLMKDISIEHSHPGSIR